MAIKARGRATLRVVGSAIILIGLVISIFLNYLFIKNIIFNLITIAILLPWLLMSILLKFELNFFKNNLKNGILVLIIYSILMFTMLIIWSWSNIVIILIVNFLNFLLLICWHFSLSIFKKKKIIFLISGLGYTIGIIWISVIMLSEIHLILTINMIIIFSGLILILGIEYNLQKLGYLNYN